jgi:CRP/FNR family cyclic AMP-dependent transcriptional regulator
MLSQVPLFAQLPPETVGQLGTRLRRRRYGKGDTVFYQGDPGMSLCIVQQGRVKLALTTPEGREIIIDLLGPGDVFGELALLDGEPRSADAVATEASELLLLERDEFIRFLLERPSVAVELLGILSRRLRRDAQLLQDAAFLDVPARLARTILRLAEAPSTGGQAVTPRLNQTDLAGLTGTTRETLNKWLGFFQQQGMIRLDKGRISVLEPRRLRERIV